MSICLVTACRSGSIGLDFVFQLRLHRATDGTEERIGHSSRFAQSGQHGAVDGGQVLKQEVSIHKFVVFDDLSIGVLSGEEDSRDFVAKMESLADRQLLLTGNE